MSEFIGAGVVDPELGTYDPFPPIEDPVAAPVPAIDAPGFVALLPEFVDATRWLPATVTAWIATASLFIDATRWGNAAPLGTALYVAHNLVLGAQAAAAVLAGTPPGLGGGVISAKTVGPLSKSYDVAFGSIEGAAAFNLTTYGVRYQQLVRLFGAGGIQL